MLDLIETDHPKQNIACFCKVLDKWLKVTPTASWKTLEVALTNVRRLQLCLNPVDDVYGEESVCVWHCEALFLNKLYVCTYSLVVLFVHRHE